MKHHRAVLAVAAMALLAAAGCGNVASSPQGSAAPEVNPTARLDGVTLTLWTAVGSAHEADQVISAFEHATGAKVNPVVIPGAYDSVVAGKLATGAKPDLMFWEPTPGEFSLIRGTEALQNLDGQPWVSKISPNVASMGKDGGHWVAGMVTTPTTIGVYYNKQDFAKAGITSTPSNFADLLTDAHKLKTAGITPFDEAGGDKWPVQWIPEVLMADLTKSGTFWPAMNTNRQSWTNPAILSAITQYQDIIKSGLTNTDYKTATFPSQTEAVFSGTAGMAVQFGAAWEPEIATQHSPAQINAHLGFFPISPHGNIATYTPDQSNAVVLPKTGNAKQEAAARQFLAFWLGPDYKAFITNSKTTSIEPSVPSPATVTQTALANFASLKGAVGAYQEEGIAVPDLYLYLMDMLYGTKTPMQVAEACESQFKQIATAEGARGF